MCIHIHTHMHAFTYRYVHTYTHTCPCLYIQICACIYTHICMHLGAHIHTQTHNQLHLWITLTNRLVPQKHLSPCILSLKREPGDDLTDSTNRGLDACTLCASERAEVHMPVLNTPLLHSGWAKVSQEGKHKKRQNLPDSIIVAGNGGTVSLLILTQQEKTLAFYSHLLAGKFNWDLHWGLWGTGLLTLVSFLENATSRGEYMRTLPLPSVTDPTAAFAAQLRVAGDGSVNRHIPPTVGTISPLSNLKDSWKPLDLSHILNIYRRPAMLSPQ